MDFLRESWERAGTDSGHFTLEDIEDQRKAAEKSLEMEKREKLAASPNVQKYLAISEAIQGHTDLISMLREVEDAGVEYFRAISEHVLASAPREYEFDQRDAKGRSDHNRRIAHEALVSRIQAFCRAANAQEIDINPIRDIVIGREEDVRNQVRTFMKDVLNYLGKEAE